MSTTVFVTYADAFSSAADMHRKIATPLDGLEDRLLQIDEYLIKNDFQGEDKIKDLIRVIPSTRKNIRSNFSQIGFLEPSFNALAEYVYKKFGTRSVDTMLSQEGIKVYNSYKKVSDALSQTISESNVKEE